MSNIREAQDRFYGRKWGVFNHFLYVLQNDPLLKNSYGKHTSWDELVNEFDTEKLARTLYEVGAGYYVITVMQGSKYMIAPNLAFDEIARTLPGEACSSRDLIEDLYCSLSKYNIDLFLYFTGDGPYANHPEGDRFGFIEPRKHGITREFVEKWGRVLEEYAVRYGDKIKGWWIDGCYKQYFGYTDELLEIYYKACKKGNSDALVALNNGISANGIDIGYEFEDFVCGERPDFDFLPTERFCGGAQVHMLAPMGTPHRECAAGCLWEDANTCWGSFGMKRSKEYLADFALAFYQAGGVISFDVGVYRDGSFDAEQKEALKLIGEKFRSFGG